MNFIITTQCDKGCPYCFASKARQETIDNQHMTLDYFKVLLDKIHPNAEIKLLGGEPTKHPQFKEFVEELLERKKSIHLISNLLFEEDTLNFILENIDPGKPVWTFLINSTDIDKSESRLEKFVKNYKAIYSKLYSFDGEDVISCGLTIEMERGWEYYVKYLDFLVSKLTKIERLRISLEFPDKEKNNFWFINNKKVGELFLYLTKCAMNHNIPFTIDCILYPCVFANKEEYKVLRKFSQSFRHICCDGVPYDIFPDKTASFCYPTKDFINIKTEDFASLENGGVMLREKYNVLQKKIELPKECIECKFFIQKICAGPCLGFYDIK